jgi:hypothetical protein
MSAPNTPELAELFSDLGRFEQRVALVVRQGHSRGQLAPGAAADVVASLLVGALLFERFVRRHPLTPDFVAAIVTTVLAGSYSLPNP